MKKTSVPHPWRKSQLPLVPTKVLATKGLASTHQGGEVRETDGVVFIPHTDGSALQRILQVEDDKFTETMRLPRSRYVERAGMTLRDILVKKNPWYQLQGGCGRADCYVCLSNGGKGTNCRREGACYSITCKICDSEGKKILYLGETSRSPYERLNEHFKLFKGQKEGCPEKGEARSALWLHSKESHEGEMVDSDWGTKIISSHKTALNRQVTEATLIMEAEDSVTLLNSKNEFGANNLSEVAVRRGDNVQGLTKRGRRRIEEESEDKGQSKEVRVEEEEVSKSPSNKRRKGAVTLGRTEETDSTVENHLVGQVKERPAPSSISKEAGSSGTCTMQQMEQIKRPCKPTLKEMLVEDAPTMVPEMEQIWAKPVGFRAGGDGKGGSPSRGEGGRVAPTFTTSPPQMSPVTPLPSSQLSESPMPRSQSKFTTPEPASQQPLSIIMSPVSKNTTPKLSPKATPVDATTSPKSFELLNSPSSTTPVVFHHNTTTTKNKST